MMNNIQWTLLDEPPPAYDTNTSGEGAAAVIEAPPPYCLIDPSKLRNTDHLPQYPQITPVEVIDLQTSASPNNDQVRSSSLNFAASMKIFSHLVKQPLLDGLYLVQIWILAPIVHFSWHCKCELLLSIDLFSFD